ncbi:hypothetical protein BGX30_009442, partial [Mortierella sp. GBA39]
SEEAQRSRQGFDDSIAKDKSAQDAHQRPLISPMVWDLDSEIDLLRCAIANFVTWDDPSYSGEKTEDGKETSSCKDWNSVDEHDSLWDSNTDSESDLPSIKDAMES